MVLPVRPPHDGGDALTDGVSRSRAAGHRTTGVSAEGVAAVTRYQVTARRWRDGWELHVASIGVTQVRTLDRAAEQACDLIETMTGSSVDPEAIDLLLDLDGLEIRAAQARRDMAHAEELRRAAAAEVRHTAAALRGAGLSVTDIATVLEVSRGRASQYLAEADGSTRRPRRA